MVMTDEELDNLMETLYEEYGRPLEEEHWGEFVAISKDGRTLLGQDLQDVLVKANAAFGPGVFVYKVGPRAVGRI